MNMIRFLLDNGASVDATTKVSHSVLSEDIVFICGDYISTYALYIVMVALCNRATIICLPCDCFLLLFFPRLISAAVDWMSTIFPHIVWP